MDGAASSPSKGRSSGGMTSSWCAAHNLALLFSCTALCQMVHNGQFLSYPARAGEREEAEAAVQPLPAAGDGRRGGAVRRLLPLQ